MGTLDECVSAPLPLDIASAAAAVCCLGTRLYNTRRLSRGWLRRWDGGTAGACVAPWQPGGAMSSQRGRARQIVMFHHSEASTFQHSPRHTSTASTSCPHTIFLVARSKPATRLVTCYLLFAMQLATRKKHHHHGPPLPPLAASGSSENRVECHSS